MKTTQTRAALAPAGGHQSGHVAGEGHAPQYTYRMHPDVVQDAPGCLAQVRPEATGKVKN